jgi:hypothetical protein
MDISIVNFESSDYKNTRPSISINMSPLFETIVYVNQITKKTEIIDIKEELVWTADDQLLHLNSYIDTKQGTVWFTLHNKLIGKKI